MASENPTTNSYTAAGEGPAAHGAPPIIKEVPFKDAVQGGTPERQQSGETPPETEIDGDDQPQGDDKPNGDYPRSDSRKPDCVPTEQQQKFASETAPQKPGTTAPPQPTAPNTSYRPAATLDSSYAKPPSTHVPPKSSVANHMTPQQPRKPDVGYQQSYQNQPRQYQSPYSSSSYQAPPASQIYSSPTSQTYSSPQLKSDISRSPTFTYPNTTPPTPVQRTYPTTPSYDLTQQSRTMNQPPPRPHLGTPQHRPQIYQPSQRILPESYQKTTPSMQPMRPSYVSQSMTSSSSTPPTNHQYSYTPMRTTPLSSGLGMTSTIGDSSLRMYKTDTASVDPTKLKPQPTTPLSYATDPTRTAVRPGSYVSPTPVPESAPAPVPISVQQVKKPETQMEEVKPAPTPEPIAPEPVKPVAVKPEEPKQEEEKEPGIVLSNVKFFEERDTAKVPLTPKMVTSPVRPLLIPTSRSDTFANVVKGEAYRDEEEYESGVDESPLVHPNLRSVAPETERPERRRMGRRGRRASRCDADVNNSYPSTPVRLPPDRCWSGTRASSRSHKCIADFTPEEELLFFFNIAKANNFNVWSIDRNQHISRINDIASRKENVPTSNGDVHSVTKKTPSKLPGPGRRSVSASAVASSPAKTPIKSPGVPKSLPKTPDSPAPTTPLIKKVPMNKIQVGAAPSPNLKAVRSKIGSLANTTHKPGGGNIKIESHKVDFSKAQPRIAAKNDTYAPGGGDKKIQQVKLNWSAKPKVGSLENATHKPGGGDKKIESVKLDFKDRAKPKVGSKDNVKHVPGGGAVKIESQKLEFKAQSKVGSLDNVKHKPGGGDVKIFDDKTYLKQVSCGSSEGRVSGNQSYCDLSVVSEVHSVSAPGTPHHGTAIKIKKSTTLGRNKPHMQKTTEVTVVSRSPSVEMRKSPSTHEVKLTYAKVASPKHGKLVLDNVGPVRIVNVPANENGAILKPSETPFEVKNLISSFEQQITKGLPVGADAKAGYAKTRPESHRGGANEVSEELTQKFSSVRDELDRVAQEKAQEEDVEEEEEEEETPASKFLKNEMATHEKVGEMWKEVHNIGIDKPKTEENMPPPPPPTPSVAQKLSFQSPPQQLPPPGIRPQSPRGPFPPRSQNQQAPGMPIMPRPPNMQQRPPHVQNPQMRPPMVNPPGSRQPHPPEMGYQPRPMPPRSPMDPAEFHHMSPQQQPSGPRPSFNPPPK